jgi:hypothetical protein
MSLDRKKMLRAKTNWKSARITIVIALLIVPLIAFGATQNETLQNITQPENSTSYVTDLNESELENITDVTAPVITIQTPENVTDNTSVIGLNYTINESAKGIGYSRNNATNVTESLIGTPKLVANKDTYSLDEEPAFSFKYNLLTCVFS